MEGNKIEKSKGPKIISEPVAPSANNHPSILLEKNTLQDLEPQKMEKSDVPQDHPGIKSIS